MKGRVNSIQTLGALDGPGVRFTVFMQGCPLRCGCCHNPDTWDFAGGAEYTPVQLAEKAARYKEYFAEKGGITVTGGEPLSQADFVAELFRECKARGLNTCLDTSGCLLNDSVKSLLDVTDLVMLDIKYTDEKSYSDYVGCSYSQVIEFLDYAQNTGKDLWIRQVIIPSLNDDEENIIRLAKLVKSHPCVKKTELLPFKKLCDLKYKNLGIPFRFADIPQPSSQKMIELETLLEKSLI